MPDQRDEDERIAALDDEADTQVDQVIEPLPARDDETETSTVVVDLRKTLRESRRPDRRATQSLTAAEAECLKVIAKDGRARQGAGGLHLRLDHWSDAKLEKLMGALHSLRKRRVLELVTRVDRIVVAPGPFEKHVKPLLAGRKSRKPPKPARKAKPRAKR